MFQTSSKCYDRAVLLWSRPIVLATTLPNKEGSWVLGLQGSVAKILQNPVESLQQECSKLAEIVIENCSSHFDHQDPLFIGARGRGELVL